MKGGFTSAVGRIHVPTGIREKSDDRGRRVRSRKCSKVQGSVAQVVARVGVRTHLKAAPDAFRGRGFEKRRVGPRTDLGTRGPPKIILHPGIRAQLQQPVDDSWMVCPGGKVKRGLAAVVLCVDIRPGADQSRHHGIVASGRGLVQGRIATIVAGIHRRAGVQEHRNVVPIALRRGPVECRPTSRTGRVNVRPRPHQCGDRRILGRMSHRTRQQRIHNENVHQVDAPARRCVKRGLANGVPVIHIRSRLE